MTNENLNLLGQKAAAVAVGSGVLLGCVIVAWIIMQSVLIYCLIMCVLSWMADKTEDKLKKLNRTQSDKDNGEESQMAGELDKRLRLINKAISAGDELLCRPVCIFRKPDVEGDSGTIKRMVGGAGRDKVEKLLEVARRGGKKNSFTFSGLLSLSKSTASLGVIINQ